MNDERPIERLLRRYAMKRREDAGAPLELHPATRRMLQGELARQFPGRETAGGRERTTFAQILLGWRARLVWVVPVLVVLGISVWLVVEPRQNTSEEFQLAKHTVPTAMKEDSFRASETPRSTFSPSPSAKFSDQADVSNPALPVPAGSAVNRYDETLKSDALAQRRSTAATVAELTARSRNETALERETDRAATGKSATVSSFQQSRNRPITAPGEVMKQSSSSTLAQDKTQAAVPASVALTRADSVESLAVPRSAAPTAGKKFVTAPSSQPSAFSTDTSATYFREEPRDLRGQDQAQAYSQAFVNRGPALSSGPLGHAGSTGPVLVKFQVEQSGNQLRVIDGDGSTYVGEVNPLMERQVTKVEVEKKGGGMQYAPRGSQLAARQLVGSASQASQNFAFRVTGTNRTLQQPVVFTWNFVALTNELAKEEIELPSGGGNILQNNLTDQQLPLLLNNAAINGRAQLGSKKEIEINAVPVSP